MKKSLFLGLCLAVGLATSAHAQAGQERVMQVFATADTNHDGVITQNEFEAARLQQFGRLDRNGDGVITTSDFGRLAQRRADLASRLDQMITEADANHDGKVTREEFASAPMPMFERLDANHDGVVDRQELAQARSAFQQAR